MLKKTLLLVFMTASMLNAQDYKFFVISNDAQTEKSIYLCSLKNGIGSINIIEQYGGVFKGDYLALSTDNKHLLATSKNTSQTQSGLVQFEVAEDGTLTYHKEVFKSNNDLPCHVSFTPDMQYVLSANYGDDEISLYSFNDESLSPEIDNIIKPDQSKGHFICTDPSGKYVHAVFLGLNRVYNYTIDNNALVANTSQEYFSLPDGYGPRHLVFHPTENFVYILNETHSSVTACSYSPETGIINELQNISMLPDGYSGNTNAAAIRVHPNGKFLYASNRGHNSIVVYKIAENGHLTLVEHETMYVNFPRDFNITPDGKYMLVGNQKGHSILSLTINETTGELNNTGFSANMQSPVSIVFFHAENPDTSETSALHRNYNEEVVIYPIPAQDYIHIDFPGNSKPASVEIINLSGQTVKKIEGQISSSINVSDLLPGTYAVNVSTGNEIFMQKIIII